MSSRGGGSAALPAQLPALTLSCTLWKPRWLMSCWRAETAGLGLGGLFSFLFFFIFRLRTQMSNWNRVFINMSCLSIQERANQNTVKIVPGEMSPFSHRCVYITFSIYSRRCEQILTACCGWGVSWDLCVWHSQGTWGVLGLPGLAPLGSDLVPNVIPVSPGCFQPCPCCLGSSCTSSLRMVFFDIRFPINFWKFE